MNRTRIYLLAILCIVSTQTVANDAANALNTGKSFANFCDGNVGKGDPEPRLICITYFKGTIAGFAQGATRGLIYPTPIAQMKNLSNATLDKVAQAIEAGAVDGYCNPRKVPHVDMLRTVISYIKSNPATHDIPPAAAIANALSETYKCAK